jgi:hypothetical protein
MVRGLRQGGLRTEDGGIQQGGQELAAELQRKRHIRDCWFELILIFSLIPALSYGWL